MKTAPCQRKAISSGVGEVEDASTESRIKSPGGGRPLPDGIRSEMEAGLGADFSTVRVHDTSEDQTTAKGLNAKAFAYRDHIWTGPGASAGDHKLMAHELTHVVQQRGHRPLAQPPEPGVSALGLERTSRQVAMQQMTQLEQATIGGTDQGLRTGAPTPSGDLRISSPAEAAERRAVFRIERRCRPSRGSRCPVRSLPVPR
ncbi:MAG: DUF4157 domain-containing protein [Chromatiaceae bacterium]|nr:DUF4157 domain-containing protein [Chromatiaceae bacterium]